MIVDAYLKGELPTEGGVQKMNDADLDVYWYPSDSSLLTTHNALHILINSVKMLQ